MFTSNRRPSKTIPIHSYLFLIHRGIPFLCVAFIPKHEQHVKTSTNSETLIDALCKLLKSSLSEEILST